MKIIFVGPFGLQPKGTMNVRALPLAKSLVKKGHIVTMLLPPWDDPERSNVTWIDEGVNIINIKLPLVHIPFLFDLLMTYRIVKYIISNKPDIVHFFKPKAYSGLAHFSLWWIRRISKLSFPLIVDTDDWEQAWNQVLPYKWHYKKLFSWQENWGLKSADAVTVASRFLEGLVIKKREDNCSTVYYVPNGYRNIPHRMICDSDSLKVSEIRSLLQLDNTSIILLYSRFLEFRLERVVDQIKMVAYKLPTVRWLVVGQGLYGEDKLLEEQVDKAGLSEYVRFVGWIPMDQLDIYFSLSDIAVFPYDDNLINRTKCSVKLIDLLVAGVPVVADAVGQNCEYIKSGISGYLVQPENDFEMANLVIELISNKDTLKKISCMASSLIKRDYNWFYLSKTVEHAYAEAIRKQKL